MGHRPVRIVCAVILLALLCGRSFAGEDLHFERIGSESGPPPAVITAIHQDSAGFIWVGSRDGLLMYDGYTFTVFEHDAADPESISGNTIRTIFEDGRGDLWVGTNTGGLNRLDRASRRFEHFRHDSSSPDSLSHDSVYDILEDRDGDLWVATQMGLNRFDRETGRFERFHHDPSRPGSLSHDYVYELYEDREGRLWASTIGGGLNVRDPETGTFQVYRHDPDDPTSLSSDRPFAILGDPSGDLWISSTLGVNRLDPETGSIRQFGTGPEANALLGNPLATSLASDPTGKLWIGTHGGGLNLLDPATGEIRTWKHDPGERSSLGADEIITILRDSSDALWIGTWGGGLNRLTQASLQLSASAQQERMPKGLGSRDVTGLFIDRRGGLWIATRSGDVVRRDPGRMTDTVFLGEGEAGTDRITYRLVEDRDGRVWIATSAGVLRLDPETATHVEYHHDPNDDASLGPGYVKGLLIDREGALWVGTGEGGLQKLNPDGTVQQRFLHDPDDLHSLSDDYVTSILEDSHGTLWVGTRSGGLNAFDPRTGRATRYGPEPGNVDTISHHYVTSILEDAAGTLWIGTGGGGLNRLDTRPDGSARFVRFTETDGLLDNDTMGILEDDDGSIWISSRRGLSRFDARTGAFANLDGFPAGEFEPGAVARDDKTLYFGSVKGLVAVPVGTTFPAPIASPTAITSIRTVEGELRLDRPVWELGSLDVPWGEWISLQFTVLDYSGGQRHRYAYRLGGDTEEWVDLGSRREITFTGLPPGIHELAVKGRNSQGVWSVANHALSIRVVPPFWMTLWFRLLVLSVVVGLAVLGHRVRLNAAERRNRELVTLHEQRERDREKLRWAYERLRRLTRRLEAAKEEERRRIARELHDEMGPALTAVIINLQLATANQDQASTRISDTIELVDRLIDRVRDLSLDLRPPLLDELGLVPALKGYLESQVERAGIDIRVVDEMDSTPLPAEIEITAFRVVQEAVTNVIRHAGANHVTVTVGHHNGDLELSVRDDGCGFDVRSTMDGAAIKALGLLGMQERVRILGGDLEIDSSPGRGTEVRGRMPKQVTA